MRILLAEDDSVLADGLTRSLRQSGYAIDCVKNGVEADTALATQDFDLLILGWRYCSACAHATPGFRY